MSWNLPVVNSAHGFSTMGIFERNLYSSIRAKLILRATNVGKSDGKVYCNPLYGFLAIRKKILWFVSPRLIVLRFVENDNPAPVPTASNHRCLFFGQNTTTLQYPAHHVILSHRSQAFFFHASYYYYFILFLNRFSKNGWHIFQDGFDIWMFLVRYAKQCFYTLNGAMQEFKSRLGVPVLAVHGSDSFARLRAKAWAKAPNDKVIVGPIASFLFRPSGIMSGSDLETKSNLRFFFKFSLLNLGWLL